MKTEMNGVPVEICFKVGIPDVPPGSVRIMRKGNKIEISQSWCEQEPCVFEELPDED